jgi:hypothetical protein
MSLSSGVSDNDDLSSIPLDTGVYRQLIQQFVETSIERHGVDSEQTQMFKLHLSAHTTQD